MIEHPRYPVEPWAVRELGFDQAVLAQSESVFALSNGHVGVRGNLDEGEPAGLSGTYLNSFFEQRPLPYAEPGYGYPESGQSVVNITDGKVIRLLVDDQPFDLRYGTVLHSERILDLRAGVLRRVVEWSSPSGQVVRVRSTRLVSFTQRAILAIHYEVEAVDHSARVVLQSELIANEDLPKVSRDPRVAAALEHPLLAETHAVSGDRTLLIHRTAASGLRLGVAAHHLITGAEDSTPTVEAHPDWARTTVGTKLQPGERLGITKFVAYGWSSQRSLAAIRDQVDAALTAVLHTGWTGLLAEQRAYMDEFWDGADVGVDGDDSVQQAVRFGLWHVLQAGARAEKRPIAAKGLTGTGYDGHAFWDTEMFVLPVLTATLPKAAAQAVTWRHSTLPMAYDRAATLKLSGAAFAWRTIGGEECSAYWPAGTAAFHLNADIAAAAARQVYWTGDELFEREIALPIAVGTARLWMSLGYFGVDGQFHLDGVTGPDEYSAIVDDNVYTNLMAADNFRYAAGAAERWPDASAALLLAAEEPYLWLQAADRIAVPFDATRNVHEQHRGSTSHEVWDFEKSAATGGYPLMLHEPYFDLYRKQVVKQADLMLAMHWCGANFTVEEKARAFSYYEAITVRDSSLSACTQAVIAAEVGQLDLSYDYLIETAMMDLQDLAQNTANGVHVASLAGTWLALVCGFGGMRDHGGRLSFAPRLPPQLSKLCFTVRWRGGKIRVVVTGETATYRLEGKPGTNHELSHHGKPFSLDTDQTIEIAITPLAALSPRPQQPLGRTPNMRRSG